MLRHRPPLRSVPADQGLEPVTYSQCWSVPRVHREMTIAPVRREPRAAAARHASCPDRRIAPVPGWASASFGRTTIVKVAVPEPMPASVTVTVTR
jgi:hypothetical protein